MAQKVTKSKDVSGTLNNLLFKLNDQGSYFILMTV
jgi:hypothetical protein